MAKRTGRYAHRAHQRRKRVFRRVVYAIEAVIVLCLIGFFGYKFYEFSKDSDRFTVRHVQINGLRYLDEHVVLEQSGISLNSNVIFFDAEETQTRVEAMPYVKSCGVSLQFPDTVVLDVQERIPIAALIVNQRAYEVDAEGIVLRRYEEDEMPVEPFITHVDGTEFIGVGDRLEQPELVAALDVWQAFSATPLADEFTVAEIFAEGEDRLHMFCDELDYELIWGRNNFLNQARRLNILSKEVELASACKEYLDLRFDENLVCK